MAAVTARNLSNASLREAKASTDGMQAAEARALLVNQAPMCPYITTIIGDIVRFCEMADGFAGAIRFCFDLREHTIAMEEEAIEQDIVFSDTTEEAIEAIETLVALAASISKDRDINFEEAWMLYQGDRPDPSPSKARKGAAESDFSRIHLANETVEEEVIEKEEVTEVKQYADTPLSLEERTETDNKLIQDILKEVNTEMAAPGLFVDEAMVMPFGHIWLRRDAKGKYHASATTGAFNSKSTMTTVAVLPATRSLEFPGVEGIDRSDAAHCLAVRVVDRMQMTPAEFSKLPTQG